MAKLKPRTEHEEQSAVIAWALLAEETQPDPVKKLALHFLHAIPNGFYRGFAARRKAKAEGVKAGILDLFLPAPEMKANPRTGKANYFGLYVEMKRRGEKLREGQVAFMDYLDAVRYRNLLCFTWQCAARAIVAHLDLKPGTYPPIELEGEDDRLLVHNMVEEAKRIDAIRNPPKPRDESKPKRNARPRKKRAVSATK
jgi:hypothetical protein